MAQDTPVRQIVCNVLVREHSVTGAAALRVAFGPGSVRARGPGRLVDVGFGQVPVSPLDSILTVNHLSLREGLKDLSA
jgi:hypothetical protein